MAEVQAEDIPPPDSFPHQMDLGMAAVADERWDDAVAAFEAAHAIGPSNPGAAGAYAGALKYLDRLDEARMVIELGLVDHTPANTLVPGDEVVVWGLGTALGTQGRFAEAVEIVATGIDRHPDSKRLHMTHAWAASNLEDWDVAAAAFAEALRIEPGDEDAACKRSVALKARGRVDEARTTLAEAIAYNPDSQQLHIALGDLEYAAEKWHEAEAAYAAAHRRAPGDAAVTEARSRVLVILGRNAEAGAIVEHALVANPGSNPLLTHLGWAEFAQARWQPALEAFAKVDAEQADGSLEFARVYCLRELRRFADAEAAARTALEAHPDTPELHREAGRVALARHDYAAATTALKRALELAPADKGARKALRRARLRTGYWPALVRPCTALDRATRREYSSAHARLRILDSIDRLDSSTRASVTERLSGYAWRRARIAAAVDVLSGTVAAVWFGLLVLTGLALVVLVDVDGGVDGIVEYALAAAVAIAVAGAGVTALVSVLVSGFDRRSSMMLLAGGGVLCLSLAAFTAGIAGEFPAPVANGLVWGFGTTAAAVALLFLLLLVVTVTESAATKRLQRKDPHSACVDSLMELVTQLRYGVVLTDPKQIASATGALERAATTLRLHLKAEPAGDIRTDAWMAQRADGHAAALRDCKKLLLSPAPGTVDALRRRLVGDLASVIHGHWRYLGWTDPAPVAAKTRQLRAVAIARTTLIALLPLAVVVIAGGQGWLGLDSDSTDRAVLVALGWALISFIMPLDPGFTDKFAALRGGVTTFGPDKGKEKV